MCDFSECTRKISLIGKCRFCKKTFCVTHRLSEDHSCENEKDMKQTLREQNMAKLKEQQTRSVKI